MSKKILTQTPARPLTSREIAKIIASVIGGFANWCDIGEIDAAIDHIVNNAEAYKATLRLIR